MKNWKLIICLLLVFATLGTLCACGGNSETKPESVEDKVRDAVTYKARLEYFGSAIGGNDLKSSSATISTVKKVSDTEYKVSGKMVMTDVYGTRWSNNFDCKVTTSNGDSWSARSFEYTGSKWTKN